MHTDDRRLESAFIGGRRALRSPQRHRHVLRLSPAIDEQERRTVAGLLERSAHLLDGADRLSIDLLDHVAFLNADLRRRAIGVDGLDHDTLRAAA